MGILSFVTTLIAHTLLFAPCLKVSFALDSISQSQTLSDGATLVSSDGVFQLGFFSPGSSNKRYLGIWFKKIPVQTVVWVANRANPINDSNGILILTNIGNLVLTHNNTPVWDIASSLKQPTQQKNPVVAQLLDSGNLVVREENDSNPQSYLWQSFDYPTDTGLAGMKFGFDRRTGLNRKFTAWKSPDDPAPGDYSWSFVMHGYPDMYMEKGTQVFSRRGPWNGISFSGTPDMSIDLYFDFRFVFNEDETYYSWTPKNSSVMSITVLKQSTYTRYRYIWTGENWEVYSTLPRDRCDTFNLCGANGYCETSAVPHCHCLKGFKPKSPQKWDAMDRSQGCVRIKPLSCKEGSVGFMKLAGLKLPDTTRTWLDETMSLDECREKCLSNCSCMAFTNSDIRGAGSGCVMWFDDLIDIKQFAGGSGQDLYVRMDASEIEREETAHKRKKKLTVIVAAVVPAISAILLLGFYCMFTIQRNMKEKQKKQNIIEESDDNLDLPLLDLWTIATATDKFSDKNKIGEGGFGPVYKGRLVDGQEIAVKKLSRSSGQGMMEFKNEVKLIAKLQHRNLVKLLGYCIQGQEKILVYEYMPNNSLDSFIFDSTKGKLLDWFKRFHIICGIAQGLLYLHQYSRLRIIHRDLKASNVLLDDKLNPKISDFGLAKTCRDDRIEGSTKRIVGTYGYMAPEYAIDGQFSVKSDVFSFGVLLLEIISGKRNRGLYHANCNLNLSGHAWELWNEGKATELIDPNIENSCIVSEALRCIHVSLLCVQQYPEDRPSMPSVVLMLGSEIELPMPKEPSFFPRKLSVETNPSSNQGKGSSTNVITITSLTGR